MGRDRWQGRLGAVVGIPGWVQKTISKKKRFVETCRKGVRQGREGWVRRKLGSKDQGSTCSVVVEGESSAGLGLGVASPVEGRERRSGSRSVGGEPALTNCPPSSISGTSTLLRSEGPENPPRPYIFPPRVRRESECVIPAAVIDRERDERDCPFVALCSLT